MLTEKERAVFKDGSIEDAFQAWVRRNGYFHTEDEGRKAFLLRIRFLFQSGQLS